MRGSSLYFSGYKRLVSKNRQRGRNIIDVDGKIRLPHIMRRFFFLIKRCTLCVIKQYHEMEILWLFFGESPKNKRLQSKAKERRQKKKEIKK